MMPADDNGTGEHRISVDWEDCENHNPPSGKLVLVWSSFFNHADSAVFYAGQCQIKDITHWAIIPNNLDPEDYDDVVGPAC